MMGDEHDPRIPIDAVNKALKKLQTLHVNDREATDAKEVLEEWKKHFQKLATPALSQHRELNRIYTATLLYSKCRIGHLLLTA